MSGLVEVLAEVEAAGAALRLDGEKVRIRYQEELQRRQLAQLIAFLRAHRHEVADLLRARAVIPAMPPGVRLLRWNLKQPPIAIETCGVVVDPALFARSSLEQLRVALAEPRRWVGWTIPQLIDRLRQVGVEVALEPERKEGER
ncbi:MAG: hypothetical protein WAR21_00295 [Candidatus Acidiferrales bacterium]